THARLRNVHQVCDLAVGQPKRVLAVVLGDAAFDSAAKLQGEVGGAPDLDCRRAPAEQPGVEVQCAAAVAGVEPRWMTGSREGGRKPASFDRQSSPKSSVER